jgi:hypothetical protein
VARIKLTTAVVTAAKPQPLAVELRDTFVPGFLCKIMPSGRKVFMLQYRTNGGERRKPSSTLAGFQVVPTRKYGSSLLADSTTPLHYT